jgi:UDP-perosamine 4-acetyltransferase
LTAGVIVIGAGGHAKVCIELLRATGNSVAYCVGAPDSGDLCLGTPVLHGDEQLARLRSEGYDTVFVAIGANAVRQRLATFAIELGFRLVNAISPRAVISPSVTLGLGVAVMPGAVINADSVVGDLAIINTLASVDHEGRIGTAVHIAPHCGLAGNVTVGSRSFLGIGSKVVSEIVIGADVAAAAGSVIVANVASNSRIAGAPAKAMPKKELAR